MEEEGQGEGVGGAGEGERVAKRGVREFVGVWEVEELPARAREEGVRQGAGEVDTESVVDRDADTDWEPKTEVEGDGEGVSMPLPLGP